MARSLPAARRSPSPTAREGFTLVELLLVISIIGFLSVIVLNAVNPTKNLSIAHNAKRQSDTLALVNATNQYLIDHGTPPVTLGSTKQDICVPAAVCGGADLSSLVPEYLGDLPRDPLASGDTIGYTIRRDWRERIVVEAPLAEDGRTILASN